MDRRAESTDKGKGCTTYLFKATGDKRLSRCWGSGPLYAGLWPGLRRRRHRSQVAMHPPPPCLLLGFAL